MPTVAEDIAGYVSADCLVFSFVTGVCLSRLRQMIQHSNIAKMDFTWSLKNAQRAWCLGDDVITALKKEWIAELTCPLSSTSKEECPVWSSPKTLETAVYAALNMCPSLGVTVEETLELLNIVFLTKNDQTCGNTFTWQHFLDEESALFVEKGNLPVFDLFHVGTQDTPFTTFLQSKDENQTHQMLVKKFISIFNRYR
uniref:NADP-dependent oxidoreductase domain-containing protein 1-like n=1 Tax=Phallusia mammillata TaxID=59560 RepID=A0A6F9DN62_9ASCI|nr:NADP-dependent oxidoreductase domain-containing protein 1-like [Phallusia mammillata]